MKKIIIQNIYLLLMSLTPLIAYSHHAFWSIYDGNNISIIEGTITNLMWRNPHAQLTIETDEGDSWHIETNSISILSRMGVDNGLLSIGNKIAIAGNQKLNGDKAMWTDNILLPDGREVILRPGKPPYWEDSNLSSSEAWLSDGDIGGADQGIFRVWSTRFNGPGRNMYLTDPPLTETALVKFKSYNPLTDDPTANCNPKGMPAIMHQPYPVQFSQEGDKIYFHIEEYDLVRTIHMNKNIKSPGHSLLGHSLGSWDNGDLLVTTTDVDWHYLDSTGIPISNEAAFEERFSLSEDGANLNYTLMTTDPATFTETVTQNKQWVWREGEVVKPYICTNYDS